MGITAKKLLEYYLLEPYTVAVKFYGRHAIFTSHASKHDTQTYLFPTPSAARGMLEAIYFKTLKDVGNIAAFHYQIMAIALAKHPNPYLSTHPLQHQRLKFNGLRDPMPSTVGSPGSKRGAMNAYPLNVTNPENRIQRTDDQLLEPCYIVFARMTDHVIDQSAFRAKHHQVLLRRLKKKQCYTDPYFGKMHMLASFNQATENDEIVPYEMPTHVMLYDWEFNSRTGHHVRPLYFEPQVINGVLHCDTEKPSVFGNDSIPTPYPGAAAHGVLL